MNKNVQKLISDIMTQCVKNGINFRLEYTDQVDQENIPCSGYFDEQTLAVATKKEKMQDWLDILVHDRWSSSKNSGNRLQVVVCEQDNEQHHQIDNRILECVHRGGRFRLEHQNQ